nr:immunoglobulin heavy chain junction region [Mus musculus]
CTRPIWDSYFDYW